MEPPQINADERRFKHVELTRTIIGVFYEVYNELGFGYAENVYENSMEIALTEKGLTVVRQAPIQVHFRGRVVGEFRSDMLVNSLLLLELKATRTIDSSHEAQTLNYLKATSIEIGLLLNFGPKPEARRYAFDNSRKNPRPSA
jgi:GxxExxY protein